MSLIERALFSNIGIFIGRYSRKLISLGLALGTFGLLGFLIIRDWGTLKQSQWHLRPSLLILALSCHAVSLAGTFIVWKLIMHYLGSPVRIKTDFHIFFLSLAAKKIPSAIWYTGTRLFLYAQEGVSVSLVLSAIVLEFGIAFLTGGLVFIAFWKRYLFIKEDLIWVVRVFLALTLFLPSLFLLRPRLFTSWIQRSRPAQRYHFVFSTFPGSGKLLICAAIYLVAWIVGGTSFYLTIWAFIPNSGINWSNAIGIATLSTLIVLISTVLPTGTGLKELTAGILLSNWLPIPVGMSIAVAYRILQMIDEAFWVGLAYFFRPKTLEHSNSAFDYPKEVLR